MDFSQKPFGNTKEGIAPPERVRVYEKIRSGIWVYNGLFQLIDWWTEQSDGRKVFKFKLQFAEAGNLANAGARSDSVELKWIGNLCIMMNLPHAVGA